MQNPLFAAVLPARQPLTSLRLLPETARPTSLPPIVSKFPEFRYMGSKRRLLPWIYDVLSKLDFSSAWDPFSGSGCVGYLLKAMGKETLTSDFLNFPTVISTALVENPGKHLSLSSSKKLFERKARKKEQRFIQRTFENIFFNPEDLQFLDHVSLNISEIKDKHTRAVAMTALLRSCLKKQPRGVFTITGDLSRYDDGRRDLSLSIEEHFEEQLESIQSAVFDNGKNNRAKWVDIFSADVPSKIDLVYLDPPYVPRSDDNCYVKRYHFLEGLSCYWRSVDIDYSTKTRKIAKRYTPFSYRKTAESAFEHLFSKFSRSKIVLSYSSNGYPNLDVLHRLISKTKRRVEVFSKPHTYHFGTHASVERSQTTEYLIVAQ